MEIEIITLSFTISIFVEIMHDRNLDLLNGFWSNANLLIESPHLTSYCTATVIVAIAVTI